MTAMMASSALVPALSSTALAGRSIPVSRGGTFDTPVGRPVILKSPVLRPPMSLDVARLSLDTGRYGASDIQRQIPISGLVERTISVAERLTPPPAVQALEYALASKAAVVATLADLSNGDAGHPKGVALGDVPMAGFRKKGDDSVIPTLAQLLADRQLDVSQQVYEDADTLPGQTDEKHESDYFTAAVQAIDNSIAIMRLVEGRIALFQKLASTLQDLKAAITASADEAATYLRSVDVEVAEARHDLSTAERLREEEQDRVASVNARRTAVLQNDVKAIAWRRARSADVSDELPSLEAASGLAPDPVVSCRRGHEDAPAEIHDYVQLLREVPVSWFPAIAGLVVKIEQLESAQNTIRMMIQRAAAPVFLAAATQATAPSKFLRGVQGAMVARRQIVESRRIAVAALDVSRVPLLSLSEAQAHIGAMATIGDLITGAHRQPALTRAASDEIAAITTISGCLHESFGEVAPIVRLGWAETLSEFDRPAPMANLAGLPGWVEVPLELRRNLQGLVDWLFSRIDRSQQPAQDAINELVRICLLMAAQSPVDQIIPAHLAAPAPATLGAKLFLMLDISRVRTGMMTLVRDERDRIISRAVIDDIADGRARATVTQVEPAITTFTPAMRFQLVAGMAT
jgi:hypothetical protein